MVRMHLLRNSALAALLFATPAIAGAVTFTVNNLLDLPDASPGDGFCSWNPALNPNNFPVCTLRAAIMEGNATEPDVPVSVRLAPAATYVLSEGELEIVRRMDVGVPQGTPRATIDAKLTSRIFAFRPNSDQSRLYGIELTGGRPSNSNSEGSAIYLANDGQATFDNLDVHDNINSGQGLGCAIYAREATAIVRDSRVHDNGAVEAEDSGLCSHSEGSRFIVIRSTIDHNTADGVNIQNGGSLWLQSSTVANNDIGGVLLRRSAGTITHSTIAGNAVNQIHFRTFDEDLELELFGSIVDAKGSLQPACNVYPLGSGEAILTTAWNLYSDSSCSSSTPDPGSISDADLQLSELGDFGGPTPTRMPLPGSDAIDRAPTAFCSIYTIDQRSLPRSINLTGTADTPCDIGAVEVQRTDLLIVDNTDDLPDDVPGDGICSYDSNLDPESFDVCTLRAAIMEANTIPAQTTQSVSIQLEPGATYLLEIPGSNEISPAAGDLDIKRRVDIGVPPDADHATIDANGLSRTFEFFVEAAGSRLYGLELTGGFEPIGEGAAVRAVEHVVLERLDVHGNTAGDLPGGLNCAVYGHLSLLNSRIHHNGDDQEPVTGVCSSYDLAIRRSTIDHNTATGIDVQGGSLFMLNSTVTENAGVGIYSRDAHALVSNSTVSANGDVEIYSHALDTDVSLILVNSIVDDGETAWSACNIYSVGTGQVVLMSSWNLFSDESCVTDMPDASSIYNATANLSELGDFGGLTPTRVPLAGSDAVDRGPPSLCGGLGIDQRGLPRPVNVTADDEAYCDTGAVELQESGPQVDAIFSDSFEDGD